MASYTTNYNLKKPAVNENYNIGDINANMNIIDDKIKENANNLETHKDSSDHDERYYTQDEIDSKFQTRDNNLETHKDSSDHDERYYTETELDNGQLDDRYYTENEIDSKFATRDNNLNAHETSSTAHSSDDITNNSEVQGNKVSDALDSLQNRVNNIVGQAGDSNTEIVDARYSVIKDKFYGNVGERFDAIEKSIEISIYDFGAKGDGISNDTQAFIDAIDYLNDYFSHVDYNTDFRGGILKLGRGVFNVDPDQIIIKSAITIKGENPYATRIKPISDGGFIFKRTSNYMMAKIWMLDFSVGVNDRVFAYDTTPTPANVSFLDASLSSSVYIGNVYVHDISGIGILMNQCFDSCIYKSEFINVGTDVNTPVIGMYNGETTITNPSADVTNAIHIESCRFEECSYLVINGAKNSPANINREIQFVACKFEKLKINIKSVAGLTFSACHFTLDSDVNAMITVFGNADTRNISFIGGSIISSLSDGGFFLEMSGTSPSPYDVKFIGTSVTNIRRLVKNCTNLIITGLSAVGCFTPFIDTVDRLLMTTCKIEEYDPNSPVSFDYVLKNISYSKISSCRFKRQALGGYGFYLDQENVVRDCSFVNQTTAITFNNNGNVVENNAFGNVTTKYSFVVDSYKYLNFIADQFTTKTPHGYNQQSSLNVGVSNSYGTVSTITPNGYTYFNIPKLRCNISSIGSETVTIKIQFNYEDGSSAYVEKTYTTNGNTWIGDDDYITLIKDRLALTSISIYAKTTLASTSVVCSVNIISSIN